MKRFYALIAWLLIATQCLADITFHGTTGQTLYVRVQTGASTFTAEAMVEGSSGGLGVYKVTDAALVTDGMTSTDGDYPFTIRSGAESDTANDTIVASGTLGWAGTVERGLKVNVTHWAGTATATDDIAILAQLGSANFASGAIDNAAFNVTETLTANPASGGIATASFAAGATIPRVTLTDTITTYTGNTPQTADNNTLLSAISGRLPAALVSGRMDASVGAMAANVLTASAVASDAATEIGAAGGGTPADLSTEAVNTSRIFVLVPGTNGLRSETEKTIIKGSPPNTYGVDFRNDAGGNQKIYTVDSVTISSGTAGGITFGTATRDGGTQARLRVTGVTAGTYLMRVEITYVGGATARGDCRIKVVD